MFLPLFSAIIAIHEIKTEKQIMVLHRASMGLAMHHSFVGSRSWDDTWASSALCYLLLVAWVQPGETKTAVVVAWVQPGETKVAVVVAWVQPGKIKTADVVYKGCTRLKFITLQVQVPAVVVT